MIASCPVCKARMNTDDDGSLPKHYRSEPLEAGGTYWVRCAGTGEPGR
jgi:hypothetical protein